MVVHKELDARNVARPLVRHHFALHLVHPENYRIRVENEHLAQNRVWTAFCQKNSERLFWL